MIRFFGCGAAPGRACITAIVDGTGMLGPLAALLANQHARDGKARLLSPASDHVATMASRRSVDEHGAAHELQARLEILAPRFDSILIDATSPSKLLVRTALIAAHRAVITVAVEDGMPTAPARLLEDMRLFNPRLHIWLTPAALQPLASRARVVPIMPVPPAGVRMARTVLRTWRLEEDAAHLYREMGSASQWNGAA